MIGVRVNVGLRRSVLDVEGEAVQRALGTLGHEGVGQVRVGRVVELVLDTDDEAAARAQAEQMCEQLLANPVIEEHRIELVPAADIVEHSAMVGGGA